MASPPRVVRSADDLNALRDRLAKKKRTKKAANRSSLPEPARARAGDAVVANPPRGRPDGPNPRCLTDVALAVEAPRVPPHRVTRTGRAEVGLGRGRPGGPYEAGGGRGAGGPPRRCGGSTRQPALFGGRRRGNARRPHRRSVFHSAPLAVELSFSPETGRGGELFESGGGASRGQ